MVVNPRYTNRIQKDLKICLAQALLDWFGVGEDKCPVIQGGQTPIQTAARYVAFHKISSRKLGMQGRMFKTDCQSESGFTVYENWVDEMTFQINVRTKESASASDDAVTARDIAVGISWWFNSLKGISFLHGKRMAALNTTEVRDLVSSDENDLWQNTASFDLVLHIGQCKEMTEESQDARLVGIVGVPIVGNQ